jgi:WD40 repeat protein
LSNIEFKKIRIRDFITEVVNDSFRFEGSFRKYLFSSDLKLLFLISYSNQLNVWNWQQKELIYTKSFDSIRSVSISPTSNFYLTKEFFGGKYHYNVYETVSGRLAYTFSEVPEHMYYVNYFDWVTNDKDYIIDTQGLNDGIYTIYNMPTGEIEKKYKLPDFLIFENRNWIFYDLDKIAYFDTSNTDRIYNINIYSLESSKVIYTIEIEYFFPINKFYFSSDKQLLLIYFLDGSILLKKIGSTDVKEIYSYKPNFSISPNPAGEYIEIKDVRAEHALPLQDIKIYNLFGECVMVEQSSPIVKNGQTGMSDLLRINISGLPAGVYFVRVGDWVGRFLKI